MHVNRVLLLLVCSELLSVCLCSGDIIPEQSVPSLSKHTSFEENQPIAKDEDELSDENETSEGDQPPLPESDQLKEQMEGWCVHLTTCRLEVVLIVVSIIWSTALPGVELM